MCSEGQLLSQMNGWRSEAQRSDFVSRRGRGVACDKSDGDWNCQEELDKQTKRGRRPKSELVREGTEVLRREILKGFETVLLITRRQLRTLCQD